MRNKTMVWLLLISFIVRSVFASFTELNNDEVYYWTYAQKLQWNYFDHPPGIAVLLRIFTGNLFLQQVFFLRLGSIVCAAISTLLIYLIGKKIKDEFTGIIAAILFTASPYCSIIAGLLVMPDALQLVFWLWAVLLMLRIIEPLQRRQKLRRRLLLLGVVTGCCVLSKVHGVFLWVGFLSYIVLFQRKLLSNPFLYYAGFISTLLISPVILWNISNNFVSYRFHSNRVNFFREVHADSFFRELFGEMLYNNPVIFVLLILAVTTMLKKQVFIARSANQLLLLLSAPLIIVVLFMSVFSDTLPHWTGPAFTSLLPLIAAFLVSKQSANQPRVVPGPVKWATAFIVVLLIPVLMIVKWLPHNIGTKEWNHLGAGDPTLDMNGFKKFGQQFGALYKKDIEEQKIGKNVFLVSDYWFPAAHIDYYVARPNNMNFIAIGELPAIHHYAWLNKERPFLKRGDDVYFITVSNFYSPPSDKLVQLFAILDKPFTITQYRSGVAVRNFFIYRLRDYKGGLPGNGILNSN